MSTYEVHKNNAKRRFTLAKRFCGSLGLNARETLPRVHISVPLIIKYDMDKHAPTKRQILKIWKQRKINYNKET